MKNLATTRAITLKTSYQGRPLNLSIVAADDKYSVLENDKPIGYIKLGNGRHTWIVVDSLYVAPQLVNEIAKRIAA
ncbi:hypothetical protein [Mucilaginibacter sp. UR6-11]|uniref:hypothetical protein n=1 Tax=Mucilaginibacter sp. UR6-11 TaxID=1435644 RepID=UPI001E300DDC|nr:hypothetical protein [Mucilaginibacter sp. UR6-11]MCC8424818.1 hypothetical protein [Mucilaginibacter sp. UR6-11]